MKSQIPALIVVSPLIAGVVAPMIAYRSRRGMRAMGLGVLISVVLMAGAALTSAVALGPASYRFGGWLPPWGIEYVADPLSALMTLLISIFALLTYLGLDQDTGRWRPLRSGTFHALYFLLVSGLLGISITGDLFNLYVFLEISALAGYALIAAGGDRAKVAAFRYLIIGSVGASFWVLGLGYLYAVTGTLNIADMATRLPPLADSPAVMAGVAFILAGLAIKMALFPLHGWQPDAYTYAPASVMPFVSAVMAKVSAYVMIRVLYTLFAGAGPAERVLDVLGWTAALSIIAGSVLAMAQTDIRRMLAYSSVAQIGYVALGLAIGNALALTGAILHIINHAIMKGCLFTTVAGLRSRTGKTEIKDLAGLGVRMPWTSGAVTVASLSMIGLPPFCGFFSKLYLVSGAVQAGAWPFVAALAVSSLLGAIYFFRVIEKIYLAKPKDKEPGRKEAPAPYLLSALVLSAAIVLLGVFNQTLITDVVTFALPGGLP